MKHALPSLDSLKAFESAARQLSFSLAAEELCISKGAISYQIRKLEESVDCALFKRSVRQVYLTDAGQKLFHTTRRLFDDLKQTFDQLAPTDADHDVIIAATTYVALRWLSSRIARFNERHPDVSIVLQHSVHEKGFKLQDVDVAIRWGTLTDTANSTLLFDMPMPLYPVCSPEFLQRFGLENARGISVDSLNSSPFCDMTLLCEDRDFDLWQQWFGVQNAPLLNPRRVISDANVRTQAAIDGQGWTMADALMSVELASGTLVSPFDHQLEGYGYTLMASLGRYVSKKSKLLRDWLTEDIEMNL
jgi:LysR family glycine cleavage system transcriptional activator